MIPVSKDIEKVIEENGNQLNFNLAYLVEVKVRDGKTVSILWKKEVRELKHVFKIMPNS